MLELLPLEEFLPFLLSLYPFFELSFGKCPFCVCTLNLLVGCILGGFRFIFFFSKETMHNYHAG